MQETCNLSQALSIFEDNIVDIRKACVENAKAMCEKNKPYKELDVDGEWTPEEIEQHVRYLIVENSVEKLLKTIKRIDSRKQHFTSQSITDEDIIRAKEVPLTELYEGTLRGKCGKCPFHEEKSASFHIFKDNRFKCFGCARYGSSIDYVMMRDGVDFIRAVKILIA